MGTWGYKLLENDAALDIKAKWEKELNKYLKVYPNWKGQEVINFYLENHFHNRFDYGDIYSNSELLALAKLLYDNEFELPEEFKRLVENVLTLELQEDALAEWDKPQKRKEVLLSFLTDIKGGLQEITDIINTTSILEFPGKDELSKKIAIWLDSDEDLEKEYPRFLSLVDKIISSRLGYDYEKKHIEVTTQRMMLLAFYVGRLLGFPKDQILDMVSKAKNKIIL